MTDGRPSQRVLHSLLIVSGNQCAFSDCEAPLLENGSIVGEMAHIHSPRPSGPRYDPGLTDSELHAIDNLILLCLKHHKIVDDQPNRFPADALRSMKSDRESSPAPIPPLVLQRLVEALTPNVPDNWWDRPSVPVFRLGLSGTTRDPEWAYECDPTQISGGDIGPLSFAWVLGDCRPEFAPAKMSRDRKWTLPAFKFTPVGGSLELQLRFWWDGGERTVVRHWSKERDFHTAEVEIRYE